MIDPRNRLRVHEAGHAVVAHVLGAKLDGIVVRPTGTLGGACYANYPTPKPTALELEAVGQPLPLWPARLRTEVDRRAIDLLAGQAAERYADQLTTTPRPATPLTTYRTAPAEVDDAYEAAAAAAHDPERTDQARAARWAWTLSNAPSVQRALYDLWQAEAERLVVVHAGAIIALADALADNRDSLDGTAAAAIIERSTTDADQAAS